MLARIASRLAAFVVVSISLSPSAAGLSILQYNVNGIRASGTPRREALQRIVDYFDPDVIVMQEAKGITNVQAFLAFNSDYEGFYSSADGAANRRMIMSKYDIIDESVREDALGVESKRTLFSATIDLPGPHDLVVFTAHWDASRAGVREGESLASVAILQAFRLMNPDLLYLYAGDFNDVDTSGRITALLAPSVGLVLFTPIDPVTQSSATINSDPDKGTYLDRRIDYILPSLELASFGTDGRVLNTWAYRPGPAPSGLELRDTIDASDHLPVYMRIRWRPIPGDANLDCKVDILDMIYIRNRLNQDPESGSNWTADVNNDGKINILDMILVRNHLNNVCR